MLRQTIALEDEARAVEQRICQLSGQFSAELGRLLRELVPVVARHSPGYLWLGISAAPPSHSATL